MGHQQMQHIVGFGWNETHGLGEFLHVGTGTVIDRQHETTVLCRVGPNFAGQLAVGIGNVERESLRKLRELGPELGGAVEGNVEWAGMGANALGQGEEGGIFGLRRCLVGRCSRRHGFGKGYSSLGQVFDRSFRCRIFI